MGSLTARLSKLLMDLTEKQLPNAKTEAARKLEDSKAKLHCVGHSRNEKMAR
jgi:hypothetical protein